jgi:hypothetical protein
LSIYVFIKFKLSIDKIWIMIWLSGLIINEIENHEIILFEKNTFFLLSNIQSLEYFESLSPLLFCLKKLCSQTIYLQIYLLLFDNWILYCFIYVFIFPLDFILFHILVLSLILREISCYFLLYLRFNIIFFLL